MIARYVGRLLTSVAVEVGERARLLLDNLDPYAAVVFEMPTELITIVDIELAPNPGGNICLVSRHLTFGVDSVAAHTTVYVIGCEIPSVRPHYSVAEERFRRRGWQSTMRPLGAGRRTSPNPYARFRSALDRQRPRVSSWRIRASYRRFCPESPFPCVSVLRPTSVERPLSWRAAVSGAPVRSRSSASYDSTSLRSRSAFERDLECVAPIKDYRFDSVRLCESSYEAISPMQKAADVCFVPLIES
ncbi:hypothetical protein HAH_4083 [Haloarcula hispanica ATCC 33960]|uniref:Uncharacterized protein n=1 Tax=Haloarcula hispanica (strain ATCC 33960 / DSM 4426 / JCM 8911 / NBRC 102182 / NCIMB 2187 / VKM B-1755) TaxID=634497 RepID=G0HZG3_HALHT|nr:hypothetical protein HAH_4083 [Haloarcula hispanica ATCC 33960]